MPAYRGFAFAALNVPAINVSCDYYHVFPIDRERCALLVGDVSGKGPPPALRPLTAALARPRCRDV